MRIITQKRIRNANRHLGGIAEGTMLVIAALDPGAHIRELARAGFSSPPVIGERVLPTMVGPTTRRNAEGWHTPHRDQPKETVYRQMEWTRTEWRGPDKVEVTNTVDVPYHRYPRTFHLPRAIELSIATTTDGNPVVVAPAEKWDPANADAMTHKINLMLELFGHAAVFDAELAPVPLPTIQRLNWELLPPGAHPWPAVQASAARNLQRLSTRRRPVAERQLNLLSDLQPDEVAAGRGGFSGYWAFVFKRAGVVVLESFQYGNATYVLAGDWRTVSQLSKAQILDAQLHRDRIIHRDSWERRIRATVVPPDSSKKAA